MCVVCMYTHSFIRSLLSMCQNQVHSPLPHLLSISPSSPSGPGCTWGWCHHLKKTPTGSPQPRLSEEYILSGWLGGCCSHSLASSWPLHHVPPTFQGSGQGLTFLLRDKYNYYNSQRSLLATLHTDGVESRNSLLPYIFYFCCCFLYCFYYFQLNGWLTAGMMLYIATFLGVPGLVLSTGHVHMWTEHLQVSWPHETKEARCAAT